MPDRPKSPGGQQSDATPAPPDAVVIPEADPMPIPGAAGPMGGSPTGELVDGVDQPVKLPGDRPPLTTD